MAIKVYISGISGNKEVKKRQQRVIMILDSKCIKYEVIDIAEPGAEELKDFMQAHSTSNGSTISDPNPRHPLPPQIFNDEQYCGDYDMFDMANEIDEMEAFLKLEVNSTQIEPIKKLENGDATNVEKSTENKSKEEQVPNVQINEEKQNDTDVTAKGHSESVQNGKDDKNEEKIEDADSKAEEISLVKESSPVKEPSPEKEQSLVKEPSPVKEVSPLKESSPVKESTPEKEPSPMKESSPEKADE